MARQTMSHPEYRERATPLPGRTDAEQNAVCPGPANLWSLPIERRGVFRLGFGGLLGAVLGHWIDPALAAATARDPKSARSCILLWMNGGPSHIDLWDPKPGAATGGPFRAIKTRVPGAEVCEHLPRLAEQADKLAIVRGMTSREGNHQRAQYLLHTGYAPNPTIQHPSLGGWVSHQLADPAFDLPAFVSISGPSIGAGFLGVQHGPFVVQNPQQPPANVASPPHISERRFALRYEALEALESDFERATGDPKVAGRRAVYAKAVRMMKSPRIKAFSLDEEPAAVRQAYGESSFGRGCLLARRLVEAGVRFVEVVLDGWDTHQDNFGRVQRLAGQLDAGMSALVADLAARGLLERTLVIWLGEFGRTPRINGNEGRDHYPNAWSAVLAGGPVRRGVVHGATDAEGARVVQNPVSVPDLFATVASALGMNPAKSLMTPVGRPIAITEQGTPVAALLA